MVQDWSHSGHHHSERQPLYLQPFDEQVICREIMFNKNCSLFQTVALCRRKVIVGKHSKAIICGAWNSDNLLALGSEDRTISISDMEGETLRTISLRGEPSMMTFLEMKVDEQSRGENTVRFCSSEASNVFFFGKDRNRFERRTQFNYCVGIILLCASYMFRI